MKNGYKIFWTDFALHELEQTINYLEENRTAKEIRNFSDKLEETLFYSPKTQIYFKVQM